MWAHSVNEVGVRHALVDHLRGTAELASGFAAAFGGAEAGRLLGLAHDAGKASCLWQEGLVRAEAHGAPVGVDHKALGVYVAHDRLPLSQLILHGHHGGLTNRLTVGSKLRDEVAAGGENRRAQAQAALVPLLPELFAATAPVKLPAGCESGTEKEMLVRMLYSALVDADGLDTAAHRWAAPPAVAPPADMTQLWDRFTSRRERWLRDRTACPVDALRAEVYDECVAAADGPGGIYRLPAPTGSGKTLASAAFALRHAALRGKARVIVAVPFRTITEQNAAVYRGLLDDDDPASVPVVLEHHSSINLDALPPTRPGAAAGAAAAGGGGRSWARLAAENWDAPFVVTTTVQLFESLFARRPARMRKVHRLANAVIVLDEVQALPALLLPPILDALRVLTQQFGTTVLLASATQPQWWELSALRDVPVRDLITHPAPLYAALRRVTYEWWLDPRPTLAQVAARAAQERQALVIVNTVANARTVADELATHPQAAENRSTGQDDHGGKAQHGLERQVFHLSTSMCAAHRRDVLRLVTARLGKGAPVWLVSTQLIEAGVDVDFPVVFRAMAPADSLQQAAGRANREGRLGLGGGRVVVFAASDGGQPPAYRTAVAVTTAHMGPGKADPDDSDALAATYRHLYRALDVEGSSRGAVIQDNRRNLDFLAVTEGPEREAGGERDRSQAFRLIDDDTVPVVVSYGTADQLAQRAALLDRARAGMDGLALRGLQPWTTSIWRATAARPEVAALLRPVAGDLMEWVGPYDENGLVLNPTGEEFIA